jgi:AsmA-like C-terminal region/Putative zinc-finger
VTERKDGQARERALLRAALAVGATGAAETATSRASATASPAGSAEERLGPHPDEAAMAAYLSGVLPEDVREGFERHVAACDSCAEEIVAVLRVEREAAADPTSADRGHRAPAAGPEPARSRRARATGSTANARVAERARGRAWRSLAIAAGVVIVATAALLTIGAPMALDRLRPLVVTELSAVLEREVSLDGLGIALARGPGVRIERLSIGDDPRFSRESFARVDDAVVRADVAALLRGRLEGTVEVEDAALRLVRIPGGQWNVETLGGERADAAGSGGIAPESQPSVVRREQVDGDRPGVRLTAARIRRGVVEVSDRSGAAGSPSLILRDLDLDVRSPDPMRPATLSLAGEVGRAGDGRTIAVSGEIGPFTSGTTPRWMLEEVELERVPVAEIPGAPASVRGELTFRGSLESTGDQLAVVLANASGSGDLELARGSLGDANLARQVLAALDAEIASGRGAGELVRAVLAGADRDPSLAAALADPATAFETLGGSVELAGGSIELREVVLDTAFLAARASGSLTRAGELDAAGHLVVEPALASALVAAAPVIRPLVDGTGRLDVPFRATGAWPRVRLELDVAQAVASSRRLDPRWLRLRLGPALVGALGFARDPLAS